MKFVLAVLALLACSCGTPCENQPCATAQLEVAAEDFHVAIDGKNALGQLTVEGKEADITIEGDIVFSTSTPSCIASSDNPCSIELKELRVRPGAFELPTSDGIFEVDSPLLALTAPLELVDRGSGFIVPSGTLFRSCSTVEGRSDAGAAKLTSTLSMNIDIPNQGFSIEGVVPFILHVGQASCKTLEASLTVAGSGKRPWEASP